jgi:hypothetical protein
LAAQQEGVVAHRQLIALGLTAAAIQHWRQRGRLRQIHVGVYAVGHTAISVAGRRMAAVLACGPHGVLSHQPAAAHRDLRRSSSPIIHVTAPRGVCGPRGVKVHRVRRLHPDDWGVVGGIPVTSVPRTSLDLAEVLPVRQVIRVLEQAERLRVFDLGAFERLLARSHGRHGIKPLRAALAELTGEPPHVNSDWERDLLDFCDDFDIPRPELNVIVEGYIVDALWRAAKVIVELDSWAHHRSRTAFEDDRLRLAALQLAGHVVLPVTWRRFHTEPEDIAGQLRRLV